MVRQPLPCGSQRELAVGGGCVPVSFEVSPGSHTWVGFLAFPLVVDHEIWEAGDVASEEGGGLEEETGSSLCLKDVWPLNAHLFAFPSHPSCIYSQIFLDFSWEKRKEKESKQVEG